MDIDAILLGQRGGWDGFIGPRVGWDGYSNQSIIFFF